MAASSALRRERPIDRRSRRGCGRRRRRRSRTRDCGSNRAATHARAVRHPLGAGMACHRRASDRWRRSLRRLGDSRRVCRLFSYSRGSGSSQTGGRVCAGRAAPQQVSSWFVHVFIVVDTVPEEGGRRRRQFVNEDSASARACNCHIRLDTSLSVAAPYLNIGVQWRHFDQVARLGSMGCRPLS